MMRTAATGESDHVALVSRLDSMCHRGLAFQRQVRAPMVIAVEVRGKDPLQMPFIEHDHNVKVFSAQRADHPFTVGILPT